MRLRAFLREEEAAMSRLSLAAVVVLGVAIICFFVARSLLINEELVGSVYEIALPYGIASLLLGTIVYVHQLLRRDTKLSFTALPDSVASFEEYILPWHSMLVYGTFLLYAMSGLSIVIIWSLGEITGFYFSSMITPMNTLIICIGSCLVGSWVGARCDKHKFFTVIAIVIFFAVATMIITLIAGSSSLLSASLIFATSTPLYFIVALVGLWRGSRLRLVRYLQYLMSFIGPDARVTLVNQTYEDVKRLSLEHLKEDVQVV
jgi:hypothetical protein